MKGVTDEEIMDGAIKCFVDALSDIKGYDYLFSVSVGYPRKQIEDYYVGMQQFYKELRDRYPEAAKCCSFGTEECMDSYENFEDFQE